MASDPKRRREGGRTRRTTGGRLPQLPGNRVTSPYAPLEVLSADQVEHAFYQPLVSDWQNYENWQLGGGKDATQRATVIWKRALQEYQQPALDPAVLEELDAYVARRRTEIGAEDP